MKFANADQLKSFLKKESKRLNINIHNVYSTYFARELLYRLSKHNKDDILLKGSAAEITYLGTLVRAITDIDLASVNGYNETIPVLIESMNDNSNSSLTYNLTNHITITNTGIYKLSLESRIGKINQHIGIDFQDHYNRLIEPQIRIMPPIFEGDESFEIYVPSYEEYLADKLCIVVESNKADVLNTRVKDFYDIYQLHGGKYDASLLTEYFKKMIVLRGKIKLEDVDTFMLNREFIQKHQGVWESTKEKYDFLDKEIDLEGAVYYTRGVLREQLQKSGQEMKEKSEFQYKKIKSNKF